MRFDGISFILTIVIALFGVLAIYSATYTVLVPISLLCKKQLFGLITGIIIYLVFANLNYHRLCYMGYWTYFLVILLLIFTILLGSIGMGAQRWINLGIIKFQPSELTKLFLPAYITFYLKSENNHPAYSFGSFIPLLIALAVSTILILKQPDLGTAMLVLSTGLIVFWLAGLTNKFFMWSLLVVLISGPIVWNGLHEYQKKRITVFLGFGDNSREGYQIMQSKIAIGSGGFLGKGFRQGTQNKLKFLPESQTDFIFSVICEELGYLGALILLALYLALYWRIFLFMQNVPNFFSKLLAAGLAAHVIISTIVNMGMVIGLLPTVGIPLPLVSYGVSNLWITMASLGWLNGILTQAANEPKTPVFRKTKSIELN